MHLVSLKEWDKNIIEEVIDKAIYIKNNQHKFHNALQHKTLAMIFQKTSTRTRVSFEVAMTQLGGHAIFLDWNLSNFTLASIEDEVRYLSRNVDIIMARLLKNHDLLALAEHSKVPVINGCCEKFHPCQIITDLMTVKEKFGKLEGINIVYTGMHNNVCNSFILAASKLGVNLTLVTPEFHPPCIDRDVMLAVDTNPCIKKETNLKEAAKNADIVYTDSWVDMEYFNDPKFEEEKQRRVKLMLPCQINKENLEGSKALVMHDMPIHENYEITREMIESDRSIIFDQSENRLHSQKAILLKLLDQF
ncbi:MAG: ornithine carbamoyltransferase [Spirochaetota bacterium]|nr:ornithine carbamoyltransferase [Spirochaetota bacterium]